MKLFVEKRSCRLLWLPKMKFSLYDLFCLNFAPFMAAKENNRREARCAEFFSFITSSVPSAALRWNKYLQTSCVLFVQEFDEGVETL